VIAGIKPSTTSYSEPIVSFTALAETVLISFKNSLNHHKPPATLAVCSRVHWGISDAKTVPNNMLGQNVTFVKLLPRRRERYYVKLLPGDFFK
jgi:hypothetical protein